jgi:hypothetical protein
MLLLIGPVPPPGAGLLKGPLAPFVKGPLPGLLAPFVDLVFPSPVSDGTLPPWYQQPPPPGENPSNPVNIENPPSNPTNPTIPDNGTYEITNIVATYRRIRVSTNEVEDPAARYLQQSPFKTTITGPIFRFFVAEIHGGNDTIPFEYQRTSTGGEQIGPQLRSEKSFGSGRRHELVSLTFTIRLLTPGTTTPPPNAPPYSFAPGDGNDPLKGPGTAPPPNPNKDRDRRKSPPNLPGKPFGTPPKPAGPPGTTPGGPTKAPGTPPNKAPNKTPGQTPGQAPGKKPGQALGKAPGKNPIGEPTKIPEPDKNPSNEPKLKPPAKTKPEPPKDLAPTKPSPAKPTPPGTKPDPPGTKPDPKKEDNPFPIFPPFPFQNPKNPTSPVPRSEEKKAPVIQTPGGGGCCTPPGVNQANDKLDKLDALLDGAELALLKIINGKLGSQLPGGLAGFLQDKFTKLWKSRVIDRALNLMATAAAIHNAVMLSRNISATLVQTLGNALSIIGIKDGDDVAQNFSTVIGDGIESIVEGLIGAENYATLSETWSKANRIYQSAINIYQLMTDSLFGITSGLEQTAKYTGKIGNALKKSGAVLENSYNWMSEQFNFSSGKNRKIDRVIQGLQGASEIVSDLESITSEFRSVTENVAEIGTQINTIKEETGGKEQEKKDEEKDSKDSSQSPQINKSDLAKPN